MAAESTLTTHPLYQKLNSKKTLSDSVMLMVTEGRTSYYQYLIRDYVNFYSSASFHLGGGTQQYYSRDEPMRLENLAITEIKGIIISSLEQPGKVPPDDYTNMAALIEHIYTALGRHDSGDKK